MRYGSICSGIEAATVAWHLLGWKPIFFSEIEKFPCALLKHHFPEVPNFGDITKFQEWPSVKVDLVVGGTPCQSFSVAGLRQGLADPRGNLALVFLGVVDRLRPRWVVWENVPGVLSSSGGRDFGAFLGALGELGYGFAYRVLDAQNFGVPQRRRRVFVVGYLGDWRGPAAVLFEPESVCRNFKKDSSSSPNFTKSPSTGIGKTSEIVGSLLAANGHGRGWRIGADEAASGHIVVCTLTGGGSTPKSHGKRSGSDKNVIPIGDLVRRFTPRECERLQGFPEDWTLIPESSDSSRYKAIGNSMAVPVMRWIGNRIEGVNGLS